MTKSRAIATRRAATSDLWGRVLGAALVLPGARIQRDVYLRSEFGTRLPREQVEEVIAASPARAGVPSELVDEVAWTAITWHRTGVTATAAVLALPPGWWNAVTLPADVVQFFWHVIVVAQKLAYLYGWPQLDDEDDPLGDESRLVLTMFVGVMFGAEQAIRGVTTLAQHISGQVVKRLPQQALTKYAVYNIAKQVAKWIGIRLTKKKFAEFIARGIPLVGAVVAAVIAWISFSTMAQRLQGHLAALPPATGAPR